MSRLGACQRGSAAVEFALVGGMFFLFIIALLEITVMILVEVTLDGAVSTISRQIRTGQVQAAQIDEAGVRARVCTDIAILLPCSENLIIDVRRFPNFGSVALPNPYGEGGIEALNPVFEPGGASDAVIVRIFYRWSIIAPMMAPLLSNGAAGERLIGAAHAFRNEPFEDILPSE